MGRPPSNNRGFDGGSDGPSKLGESASSGGGGMRPKLQIKNRTAPVPKLEVKKEVAKPAAEEKKEVAKPAAEEKKEVTIDSTEDKASNEKEDDTFTTVTSEKSEKKAGVEIPVPATKSSQSENKDVKDKEEKKPSKKREPKIVNSRAAMLDSAPQVKKDSNNANKRDANERSRAPLPVVNKRFEQLADEERGKQNQTEREPRRAPPPPLVTNSRFAAAAEADKDYNRDRDDNRMQDRGPPPVANSRFAAAAEADRDYNRDRNENRMD